MSDNKLDEMIDEMLEYTINHYSDCKSEIIEIFNQNSYEKALEYVENLKIKFLEYPEFLKNYLHNEVFPIYNKYIMFLKKEYNGKLDRTNNKIKCYIGFGANKSEKRKYRTNFGFLIIMCQEHIF